MSDIKKIKPALSKGTRDFLPAEVAKRNYIFDTIKNVLRKYGFEQIETPAIERLETLTGKYGEEGDKLLFKILNSGDYLQSALSQARQSRKDAAFWAKLNKAIQSENNEDTMDISRQMITGFAEKGLRYDLTVPLARYVVQNQENLAFPFKRFHVGPVWRADKPQKGRYQEFYQFDADIIGSTSLYNEVELTKIYVEVFRTLGINVTIKINHRNILTGFGEYLTDEINKLPEENRKNSLLVLSIVVVIGIVMASIDKIDKIGIEGAKKEMADKGIPQEAISKLDPILQLHGENYKQLTDLRKLLLNYSKALQGIDDIERLLNNFREANIPIKYDSMLARGLNYYTGIIWEVVCPDVKIGSIGGGGRYDNLTEMFGGQNMSGVGISFGIERIYDVMEELNLFPATISQGVKVLFVPRDISVEEFTFQQVSTLREKGIPAEIFLGNVKKQKQFDYVERKNIAYLVEVGDNEKNTGLFRLRNAQTRETRNDLTISDVADLILAG